MLIRLASIHEVKEQVTVQNVTMRIDKSWARRSEQAVTAGNNKDDRDA